MDRYELKSLVKQLTALILAFALALGLLPAVTLAERIDPQDYTIASVEYLGKEDAEAYTFYKGFNDQFFVASGSRIKITYKNKREAILKVNSGAAIEYEDDGTVKRDYKPMMLDVPGDGTAFVNLRLGDNDEVFLEYMGDDGEIQSKSLGYTRQVKEFSEMPALKVGTEEIKSDYTRAKLYRVSGKDLGKKTLLKSYANGAKTNYLSLYELADEEEGYSAYRVKNYRMAGGQDCSAKTMDYGVDVDKEYVFAVRPSGYKYPLAATLTTSKGSLITGLDFSKSVLYPQFNNYTHYNLSVTYDNGKTEAAVPDSSNSEEAEYPFGWFSTTTTDEGAYELYGYVNDGYFANDVPGFTEDEDGDLRYSFDASSITKTYTDSDLSTLKYGQEISIPANSEVVYKISGSKAIELTSNVDASGDNYEVRGFLYDKESENSDYLYQGSLTYKYGDEDISEQVWYVLLYNRNDFAVKASLKSYGEIESLTVNDFEYYPQVQTGMIKATVTVDGKPETVNGFIEDGYIEFDKFGWADIWEDDGKYILNPGNMVNMMTGEAAEQYSAIELPMTKVKTFSKADYTLDSNISVPAEGMAAVAIPYMEKAKVSSKDIKDRLYVQSGTPYIGEDGEEFYSSYAAEIYRDDEEYLDADGYYSDSMIFRKYTDDYEGSQFIILVLHNYSEQALNAKISDYYTYWAYDEGEETPEWKWAEDYSSATATFTSDNKGSDGEYETKTVDAQITTDVQQEPTCTTDGYTEYTASVEFEGNIYEDIQGVDVAATGIHTWGDTPEWEWADDYSKATATFYCDDCDETKVVDDATITSEEKETSTAYKTIYTATLVLDGKTYTDQTTVSIAKELSDTQVEDVKEEINNLKDDSSDEAVAQAREDLENLAGVISDEEYQALEKKIADQEERIEKEKEEADEIADWIDELDQLTYLSAEDYNEQVEEVKAKLAASSPGVQKRVGNKAALSEAEKVAQNKLAAAAVEAKIAALTDASTAAEVKAAKAAYDALADKSLVSDKSLAALNKQVQRVADQEAAEAKKTVKVSSIRISGISNKIAVGKKIKLTATVYPNNATNKKVKWTSSNPKLVTVDQNGVVKVGKKAAKKTVVITATAADGSGKKASWKIKGMKGAVKKIALKGKKTVKAGKAIKIKAKVKAGKGANKTLKWTSSDPKIATVSRSGKVKTSKAGKGKTVKITAMATDGTGKKKAIKIKIK